MNDTDDQKLIMVVGQAPFTTPDLNQFCTLLPLIWEDGSPASASDFPNLGEIWWMLTAQTAWLAVPGRLVVAKVEYAPRYNEQDPTSARFQVMRESVEPLSQNTGFEVLRIAATAAESIEEVASPGFHLDLPIPPAHSVIIELRGNYFGPFNVTLPKAREGFQSYRCSFIPCDAANMSIYKIGQSDWKSGAGKGFNDSATDVSLSTARRAESFDVTRVKHEVILLRRFEGILAAGNAVKLTVESLDQKLHKLARQSLTRAKRQQLRQLLDELELTSGNTDSGDDLLDTIKKVKHLNDKQSESLNSTVEALLRNGFFGEDRIASAERTYAELHVQKRTAELEAKAEEAIAAKRDELRKIESSLKSIQSQLQKEESQGRAKLENRLVEEEKKARASLQAEELEFAAKKTELERQQGLLQKNLEKVTKDLREAGDEVVNRFLTIAPLLGVSSSFGGVTNLDVAPSRAPDEAKVNPETFQLPIYITGASDHDGEVKEDEFFDRFRQVVENSGFTYRILDLQRFHLSVKCGELTVLGGPSGTGKSSLPALYSRALLGDSASGVRPGCLMINVNPSWMDTRDLLGHLNTLDGQFYPAESGLFQHLILAQEEHLSHGGHSGIYMACLDEMNLSQVEHYFSDFMTVLERSGDERKIRCFSRESSSQQSRFRRWSEITLSPSLRFVGTVNFDETTRLLSDRFLDRVNLLRLTSAGLPGITEGGVSMANVSGNMVTLSDLQSWTAESALPSDLGTLLDQMRPLLQQMGCPISPRVYRGVCRFVSSSSRLLAPDRAFDVQLAQRIIPRIRSLITNDQVDGLDRLILLLKQSKMNSFEESLPTLEEIQASVSRRKWDLDA